jgi:hypothetical protein
MSTPTAIEQKLLNIDFSAYTGDDQEFKKELCYLLADNIKELHQALQDSAQTADLAVFTKICHKVAVSIDMINDNELNTLIEKVKDAFYCQHPLLIARHTSSLSDVLLQLIKSIQAEADVI